MDDPKTLATAPTPPPALAVIDWLLSGASEQQIREALAQRYPGTDARSVLSQVQQQLAAAGNPNADAVRGWCLLSYRRLYQQMLAVGDFNGCRQVVKEISVLGCKQ
jgi:hypothetical protein